MKIRLKDNSIRFRLMQGEVDRFSKEGIVTTVTCMGFSPENFLSYSLKKSEDSEVVTAVFEKGEIIVSVPSGLADDWTKTDRVGFDARMPLANNEQLNILVEKDFSCMQQRPGEDETDAFPNPLKGLEGNVC
ncbi:hypothetical protein D770_00625 [Flammeovirgaceae bacterium 311]|nr:hypothetical protein D770_00625 [Flammeovirgaceae bacterium 311]